MEEFRKVFEVKSKLKVYDVIEFDNFRTFSEYSLTFNLIVVDESLNCFFQGHPGTLHYIKCSEQTKSWDSLSSIFDIFIANNITKNSKVLIIGGGVLQDAASFCCSVFNRGIEFEYAPSTLLSMVDSCIGGKTSINFGNFKNKIGNFYPPSRILIVNKFVSTLPKVEIYSGFGEVFKFQILQFKLNHLVSIVDALVVNNELILECLRFKASIIEIDEFDIGPRLTLNFGHTFGHAIESLAEYRVPHGIGVVWGITVANEISFQMGLMSEETKVKIEEQALRILAIINWNNDWFNFQALYARILMDKKNSSVVRMILMNESTRKFILSEVDREVMSNSLRVVNSRLQLI